MASYRTRLTTQTPRSSRRSPRTPGAMEQAHQLLLAQSDAIVSLQRQLTPQPARPRTPASAAPEKCEAVMSTAAFRSWRRSVECWLRLNGWRQPEAVLHIRLFCTPALQRALDARFTVADWQALSMEEALNTIGRIALQATNKAADWAKFFAVKQLPSESISEYFMRSAQCAADCEFQCPKCISSLSEYVLLRKLMAGLYCVALKEEVFRKCTTFSDVDSLREYCTAFEAAHRDADSSFGGNGRDDAAAAAAELLPGVQQDGYSPQAAGTHQPAKPRLCDYCGGTHAPGKASCPARTLTCHRCGKAGHMKKMCRSKPKQTAAVEDVEASGIVVAATGKTPIQPQLLVTVCHAEGARRPVPTQVVPDTGAQVCVAGPKLLTALDIKPAQLTRQAGLRDVANKSLKTLGSATCELQYGGRSTTQEIFFVQSASRCYVSLEVCKRLGLVHSNFPYQTPTAAPVTIDSNSTAVEPTESIPLRPKQIPLPALEESVPQLEEWLLRHFSASTFNTGRYPLPVMAGKPHQIHLTADAKPYACHTPAPVARHWEAEVKRQLDEDVTRGVIEPVPVGEATEWCARMVVVAKKSGQPRRTIDYQKLNAACLRETHHTPTPFDMVSGIPRHVYKTSADAHWGFHQVELEESSRRLTTFITPWGRYRYRRTPMGHCAAPDAYTRRFDDAIAGIPRKMKCIDDTLIYDASVEGAFWHTYEFLETCAKKGVTLKPEKFRFCRREVDFVGFHIGWESYKPTQERLAAIRDFSMPETPSITDIRSWHGFVNQLAPFLATAPVMEPFRELLRKPQGKRVYWDMQLQEKFLQAKEVICQLAKDGLTFYDKDRPTIAITDWSKVGIGFVILQQYCTCPAKDAPFCCKSGWRLALCGSRHLTPAETGYAPVEGEALAVAWCFRKARLFLLGCPNLVVITDHMPLVKLLGNRELKDIVNPRLFALKEKTLQYRFQVRYLPGKRNRAADFLSRYPAICAPPDATDMDQADELEIAVAAAVTTALADDRITIDDTAVLQAAAEDPVYQLLIAKVAADDWHQHRAQEIACLRQFYGVRDRLALSQGLVTYTFDQGAIRLVIPETLRQQVAVNFHAGHQGLDSMLRRARQTVYWPGMEGDLQHSRDSCDTCNAHAPSQAAEPFVMTPSPQYPFQHTVADLLQLDGQMYLAYADRCTGWLEVDHLPHGATSSKIMTLFRKYFARWGAPEGLSTDGGTNLTSDEVCRFLAKWGVVMRTSSAHFPQSNGRAEAAVKSVKRLLRANTGAGGSLDTDKVSKALLQYLNTPLREVNKSPAQLATGRQLRDGIPVHRQYYKVDRHWQHALRARELTTARQARATTERQGTPRTLTPLLAGTKVWVQNQATNVWDRRGVVTEVLPHRQYTIKLDGSGRLSQRNRKHLRPMRVTMTTPQQRPPPMRVTMTTPQQRQPQPAEPGPASSRRPRRETSRPGWLNDFFIDSPI